MLSQLFLIISLLTIRSGLAVDADESAAADEPVIVKGVAGQSASLPCHVDQNECGEVYFLTWTKLERDDRWSRIYIFADNVEKPLRDLTGRARFSLNKNEAQLSINHLKGSDEALYKCDVTYVTGGSAAQKPRPALGKCPSLTFVRLDIIVKPSKAYIEYKNSQIESGSEINGIEGEFLSLACVAIGGKPAPTVSWRAIDVDGNPNTIDVKNSSSTDNMTRLVLTKQLSRTDLRARYECHVQHEAIRNNSMDTYAMIDVSVGAKSIEIVGPTDQIREGDVAVMQCIAYSSKPEVQIVWKNGTQIIDKEVKSEVEANIDGSTLNTRSFLELRVSRFDHLNAIECQAINIAMKEAITESIELKIQYSPTVVMEPKNGLTVNESSDMVSIYCTFNSNPTELIENETKWYKDDQLLDTEDSQHYISSLSGYPILTIVNPIRNDSGAYDCSVANNIGSGRAEEPIPVNVLFPPSVNLQIYPNPEQGFTIKEGDDIRMICDIIDGNPLNVTKVRWMKNDGQVVSELTGSDDSPQTEITWIGITRTMTGNYTCQAISEAGAGPVSNVIAIDVSYPPNKAVIRQINGINAVKGQNLTLECIVSDLGKPSNNIEYVWETSEALPFQTKEPILHLTDLKLSNRGNISCAAANEVGIGPKATFKVNPLTAPQIIDSLPTTIGVNEKLVNNKSFSMGEAVSVLCRVECFPICEIYWYKNNEMIDNSSKQYTIKNSIHPEEFLLNRFQSVVSTLIFNISAFYPIDRNRDTNVSYSCVSSDNGVRPGAPVRSETTFQVQYPPENLRLRPKRVDVIEDDIPPEILCQSDALPPASYRWLSSSSLDKFTIADTPLLSLNTSIQRDRAGTYTCVALNRHGEDRIDLFINVLYRPTCKLYESRSDDDQEIELVCEVMDANPNNELTFIWFLNDSAINETITHQIVRWEGLKSKVVLPVGDESLFGSWTCSVANAIGQSDPNCTLFVTPPIPVFPMGEESIILISVIIAVIIITFIVILLVLICLMRRRRQKQESNQVSQTTRENPDGSRSPTPSSLSSHLSSNQVITYKKVEANPRLKRNHKVMDVNKNDGTRKLSANDETNGETAANREMYENMPFQRKNLLSRGAYIPHYNDNFAQLTRELRRTQSARFANHFQPFGVDMDDVLYADMYDDVKSGKVKDPRIKPPLPPKGESSRAPKRPPKTKKAL